MDHARCPSKCHMRSTALCTNFLADAPFSFDTRMLRGAIASQHPSAGTAAPALEPITLSRIGPTSMETPNDARTS